MSDQSAQEKPKEIAAIYFNGFQMGMSNADVFIRLKLDGDDIIELKASYTTAKTLAAGVADIVGRLEKLTEHTFMTQKEVAEAIKRSEKKSEPESAES